MSQKQEKRINEEKVEEREKLLQDLQKIRSVKSHIYDFIAFMNDRLINYRYNGKQIFSYYWARYDESHPMWSHTYITNKNGQRVVIHDKTYFILSLLNGDIAQVRRYLDYNFCIRKEPELSDITWDIILMVQDVVKKILSMQ
jgi:hypothetical protein